MRVGLSSAHMRPFSVFLPESELRNGVVPAWKRLCEYNQYHMRAWMSIRNQLWISELMFLRSAP